MYLCYLLMWLNLTCVRSLTDFNLFQATIASQHAVAQLCEVIRISYSEAAWLPLGASSVVTTGFRIPATRMDPQRR